MSRLAATANRSFPALGRAVAATLFVITLFLPALAAGPQHEGDSEDKHLDIRSSAGDLHIGTDADAQKGGFALYPGARLKHDEDNSNALHLGILTQAFGLKLMVAKYDSNDAPAKIIDFYRDRLRKYGKVLECHASKHSELIDADVDNDKDEHSKALKCDGDNTGPVTELKVGTEDNQHVVAIEPSDTGKGSTFALVYVHTRGKQGEI
ncbi:MAG: hypothetical protein LAO24_19525 [Acidobacteriia bacterium]|nr:hypothetical protein [Terriglobia bacterium]